MDVTSSGSFKVIKKLSDLDEFKEQYIVIKSDDGYITPFDSAYAFLFTKQNYEKLGSFPLKKFGVKGHGKYKILTKARLKGSTYRIRCMDTNEMIELVNLIIANEQTTDPEDRKKLQIAIKQRPQLAQ